MTDLFDGFFYSVALGIFFLSRFSPHLVVNKFIYPVTPAHSVGILMQKVGMAIKTILSVVTYFLLRQ